MITFANDGELDIRAAMTFGVSAKDTANPFGQFGTGLKYAVAVLLRTGHKVSAFSGTEAYDFTVENLEFRGKDFGQVHMNGEALGFTTHLGEHWGVGQAYRELYCNAMDEPCWELSENVVPARAGRTGFMVEGRDIEDAHSQRHMNFVVDQKPLYTLGCGVTVFQMGEAKNGTFLKGVRLNQHKGMKFSYNMQRGIELTEDRTLKFDWEAQSIVGTAVSKCEDERAIKAIIVNPLGREQSMDWEAMLEPRMSVATDVFKNTVNKIIANPRQELYGLFMSKLRAAGVGTAVKTFTPSAMEMKMLTKACAFLENMGMDTEQWPITFAKDLGTGIEAQADIKEGRVLLTKVVFNRGTRYLAATLYEEVTHLNTGFMDCSRAMQTHLFDAIIGMGEQLAGEPL